MEDGFCSYFPTNSGLTSEPNFSPFPHPNLQCPSGSHLSCRGLISVAAFLCPHILALHSGFSLDFESVLKIEIVLTPSTSFLGLFLDFVPSQQLPVLPWVNRPYRFAAAQLISTCQTLKPASGLEKRSWSCVSWNTALCPLWYRKCRNELDGEGPCWHVHKSSHNYTSGFFHPITPVRKRLDTRVRKVRKRASFLQLEACAPFRVTVPSKQWNNSFWKS